MLKKQEDGKNSYKSSHKTQLFPALPSLKIRAHGIQKVYQWCYFLVQTIFVFETQKRMCFLIFVSGLPEKALQVALGQLWLQLPGHGSLRRDAAGYRGWRGTENKHLEKNCLFLGRNLEKLCLRKTSHPYNTPLAFRNKSPNPHSTNRPRNKLVITRRRRLPQLQEQSKLTTGCSSCSLIKLHRRAQHGRRASQSALFITSTPGHTAPHSGFATRTSHT